MVSLRFGFDREGVHAALQFLGDAGVNRAVNIDTALALEGGRHDLDTEMGLAALAPAAMAVMLVRLVEDRQAGRGKRRLKLACHRFLHTHGSFFLFGAAFLGQHRLPRGSGLS